MSMLVEESALLTSLQKFFGYESFKGDQEAIIKNVLEGNDAFVIMPTGGGKSMCYQLPALLSEGTAIVISPLIALMKNQVDAIRGFGSDEGIAHFLNSSLTKAETLQVKKDILKKKTKARLLVLLCQFIEVNIPISFSISFNQISYFDKLTLR